MGWLLYVPHTQHTHTGGGGGGGSDIIEVFLWRWMAWWRRANERRRHLSLIWINASDSSCSAPHCRVRLYISSWGTKGGGGGSDDSPCQQDSGGNWFFRLSNDLMGFHALIDGMEQGYKYVQTRILVNYVTRFWTFNHTILCIFLNYKTELYPNILKTKAQVNFSLFKNNFILTWIVLIIKIGNNP